MGRLNSFLLKFLKQSRNDNGINTAHQIAVLNHCTCKFIKSDNIRNPKASLKLKAKAMIIGSSEIRMMARYLSPITEYDNVSTKAHNIPNTKRLILGETLSSRLLLNTISKKHPIFYFWKI